MGLFIGMYEQFIDMVEDRVESFLCDDMRANENGELRYVHSTEYLKSIKQRIVDEKGNKNTLKASMLWLQDQGAITTEDYDKFLRIKTQRDLFVHKMSDHILNGLDENHAAYLLDLHDLFYKIDNWWINVIEASYPDESFPEAYDKEEVRSLALSCYEMMFNVLYGDKSEAYMQEIQQTLSKINHQN